MDTKFAFPKVYFCMQLLYVQLIQQMAHEKSYDSGLYFKMTVIE